MDRRTFLSALGAAGASSLVYSREVFGRPLPSAPYFGVHPFIESNPEAVFILRTSVDSKLNSAAKRQTGLDFASSVLVPMTTAGTPVEANVAIKPNLTCRSRSHPAYTIERSMGIVTDVWFVEGIIEHLKSLGVQGSHCFIREVNCYADFADGGYIDMAARTGADVRSLGAPVGSLPSGSVQWADVPMGIWFSRIPYLWPVNAPGSFLINIAKFKTHLMGVTGCAKNLQGSICSGYVSHCRQYGQSMNVDSAHVRPDANSVIMDNYLRHVADGIPRWDRPGNDGGIWQETWATRCLDNNSVTKPALHIMEGIYGRDGHFMDGPSAEGLATDYMSNVVLFGKNPFNVDVIAHWMGGHEPGNFGLFHLAVERGLTSTIDPMKITVFEWTTTSTATQRLLTAFARTPLLTNFLRRDYNGQTEPQWHLVNEPHDYPTAVSGNPSPAPREFALSQNFPNPFNGSTTVQFTIPEPGPVRVDVVSIEGEVVDVLAEGILGRGSHLVRWEANHHASGVYFCRLQFAGMSRVKAMALIR
ncbi:MAG: DUF362 domain-containing protein [Bacteroidota bacterium]